MDLILDTKIADILGQDPKGMSTAALAAKTGLEEDKLTRIMRYLATTHIFTEGKYPLRFFSCDSFTHSSTQSSRTYSQTID